MLEYVITASAIAVACLLSITFLGTAIGGSLDDSGKKVVDAIDGNTP